MTVGQAFDESANYYDNWVRVALPGYEDIYSTALQAISFDSQQPLHVLDLGAGTGLFSKFVFEKYPRASFTLYDLADKMLDLARRRFEEHEKGAQARFRYITGDYRQLEGVDQYDLVISSLSIHHLVDREKQDLFIRIYRLLKQPGMFINVDQVKGETPYLQALYWERWLAHVRQMGAPEGQIQASISRRQAYDQDASLLDQLHWLKAAAFQSVDCIYKQWFIGVFMATKGDFSQIKVHET